MAAHAFKGDRGWQVSGASDGAIEVQRGEVRIRSARSVALILRRISPCAIDNPASPATLRPPSDSVRALRRGQGRNTLKENERRGAPGDPAARRGAGGARQVRPSGALPSLA